MHSSAPCSPLVSLRDLTNGTNYKQSPTALHSDVCITTLRDQPEDVPSSVLFSFSDAPPSTLPSGTGVPQAVPTGAQGPDGSIYICHPIHPSAFPLSYPGSPNNATLSAIPSGLAPTSAPPVGDWNPGTGAPPMPTGSAPPSTDGQGSGGPIYICYPADSAGAPANHPFRSVPIPNAPNPSAPASDTNIPNPVPTGSPPSDGPSYVCYPADSASPLAPSDGTPPLTPVRFGPVPTGTPTPDAGVPGN